MPYEITVGRSSTATTSLGQRIKTLAIGFLVLCAAVGVLVAAFVIGIAIAGLLLAGVVVTVFALTIARLLRREPRP